LEGNTILYSDQDDEVPDEVLPDERVAENACA
jgi:hypothetical protein